MPAESKEEKKEEKKDIPPPPPPRHPAEGGGEKEFNPKEFLGLKDLWLPPTKTQLDEWRGTFGDKLIQMEITRRPQLVTLEGMVDMGGEAVLASAKEKLEELTDWQLADVAKLLEVPVPDPIVAKDEIIEKILPLVMLPLVIGEVWLRQPGATEGDLFFNTSADKGRASACKSLILSCLLHPEGGTFLKQMNEPGYYNSMLQISNPLLDHLGIGGMDIGARVKNG